MISGPILVEFLPIAPMADTASSFILRFSLLLRADNMVSIRVCKYGSISSPVQSNKKRIKTK